MRLEVTGLDMDSQNTARVRLGRGRGLALPLAISALLAGCTLDDFGTGFKGADDIRTETFTQLEPSTADVLWVVDTSCSMTDEQEALAANFPSFLTLFLERQLAFNMAVTSTNIWEEETEGLDGHMNGDPYVITQNDTNVEELFVERALMGIDDGHGDEKGLTAAHEALEVLGDTANAGFLRDDAHLAIIVVSDEPDYSADQDDPDLVDWEEFAEWLNAFKGPTGQRMADLSVIVGIGPEGFDDPDGCEHPDGGDGGGSGGGAGGQGQGADRGDGYLEAALATGGLIGSICEPDWGDLLGRVGLRATGLLDAFELTEVPALDTVSVRVNGRFITDWAYFAVDNSVRFTTVDAVPQPGEEIEIRYSVPSE